MDTTEAAYRLISQRAKSSELSIKRMIGDVGRGRTQRASAEFVGVDRRTWQRWLQWLATGGEKGQRPTGPRADLLKQAHRRVRLAPGREARLRRDASRLSIRGRIVVSNDEREDRTISVGKHVNKQALSPVIDRYLSGQDETMGRALEAVVTEYWPGMRVLDVISISA